MNKTFFTFFFLILAILIVGYVISENKKDVKAPEKTIIVKENDIKKEIEEKEPKKTEYFEEIVTLDGEPMYYAYPKNAESTKLIIYSHGQLQRIVTEENDPYMLKMKEFGKFFAENGFAFSASNQHGDNFGNQEALNDIKNSIEYFQKKNLNLDTRQYLIGFSMGGLTSVNYAIKNDEEIAKIALLAPTPKHNLQEKDFQLLQKIPIEIWHGENDINIPLGVSENYIEIFKQNGKTIKLNRIKNTDHFELETLMFEEILEFFLD